MSNHAEPRSEPALAPLRVLVADEQMPMRLLCRIHLEAAGMSVLEAASAPDALEIARLECPDAILLDVRMPSREGRDLVEQLLEDERTRRSALVFFSATAGFRDHARQLQIEGVDFLTKPFHPDEIVPKVGELVHRNRERSSDDPRETKLRELLARAGDEPGMDEPRRSR